MLRAPGDPGTGAAVQLLAPLSPTSPIAKFLDRRGPRLQQLAYRVTDIDSTMAALRAAGMQLLYDTPRRGTAGSRVNIHSPQGRRRRTGGADETGRWPRVVYLRSKSYITYFTRFIGVRPELCTNHAQKSSWGGCGQMQPFDKHLADPEELARYSSRLIDWGADALQNGHGTRRPYAPAIVDWDGMCPPEIKIAYGSTEQDVALDGALVWAAVCTTIWAQRVACFNRCVDEIPAGAEQTWWQAYDEQIIRGTVNVETLLQLGPTAANMARAKDLGVLPEQSRDLLNKLKSDLKDGLDDLRRLTVRNGTGWLHRGADATQKLRYAIDAVINAVKSAAFKIADMFLNVRHRFA
jgi:glyoxalase/bleomycin resistance protein/dioxygenase superfamily protein